MSILIRGMEMPNNCSDCKLERWDENYYGDEFNHRCSLIYKGYTSKVRFTDRRNDCPLIEVPTPHGRLIDADELEKDAEWSDYYDEYIAYSEYQIGHAPTIIEAEGE